MKIRYLDGQRLYYAFLAGGQAVIRDQAYLNRINVFPVPDSDTGTNMASTMRAIAERARAHRSATAALGSIADAALVGARGNSGIIFAQFLHGFSQELRDEHRLSVHRFAESARRAVQHARRAVLTPVEGTMLTILHDWAEALYEQRSKMTDFVELLSYSLPIAERSLKDTPKKLEVLARAGVVDAGAKGFFDFLEGVVGFIRKGSIKDIRTSDVADLPRPAEVLATRATLTKRFCAEALLVGDGLDVEGVQDLVRRSGESAIVAGSPRKLRLHVHTDDAAGLFFELQKRGTIQDIKADDMLRQYEAAHERKSPIAILTDSACDLPRAVLDDHQVHVIPFNLFFGDSLFLDKVTIEPERFYDLLRTRPEMPKSAQPSQAGVLRALEFLTGHYEAVIAVSISGGLTGFHAQLLKAREALGPEAGRVAVIDSKNLSVSEALIVLRIAEAIRAGRPFDAIARDAEEWVRATRLWVDVKTLKYMVRGGRISPLKGLLAAALNIKPIVTLDSAGKAAILGKSFSRRANMKKILGLIRRATAGRS
ncbi:MAG: DegV family EDD domain-containing protein, partial [Candidatus Aminicenantes bacterium]|nr:DegV family EDD domain-containing protein [Candidatus Aminicenantes bacterium]